MSVGMVFDYIREYDDIFSSSNEENQSNIREATQEDIDNIDSFFM